MQYQSIIRILEYCGIDCNTPDVARAKKVLAAEFAIAPGGIISIDGFDYTRNDVFNELERSDFAERLPVHVLIWQTPGLLNCLEKNEVNLRQINSWDLLRNDRYSRQIASLISPYFAVPFDKIMGKLLNSGRFRNANDWLKTLHLVDNAEDEHTALSSTRVCIADFIKLLKNSNGVTYKNNLPQLNQWFTQPWFRFVDNLPDSFYTDRNELLSAMVNFIATIQHADGDLCRKMSKQMIEVENIDPDLRNLIASNHAILYKNSRQPASERTGCSWLGIVIPVIMALRLIISLGSGSSSKSVHINSQIDNEAHEKVLIDKYFYEQYNSYFVIDTDRDNKSVSLNCCIIFEKHDTLTTVTVNVVNNENKPVAIYIRKASYYAVKYTVAPTHGLHIEGSTNATDILTGNMETQFALLLSPRILISDLLNPNAHRPNLGSARHIAYVEDMQNIAKADFTVNLSSRWQPDAQAFPGADWIYVKKL